ncbi:MAG: hypothetical protein ACOCVF_02995 [bacterium]
MLISNYGKIFLNYFNEKRKENGESEMTPKEFFLEELYPTLYEGRKKPLMQVLNSVFNQSGKYRKSEKIKLSKKYQVEPLVSITNYTSNKNAYFKKTEELKYSDLRNKNKFSNGWEVLLNEFFDKIKSGERISSFFVKSFGGDLTNVTSFNRALEVEYDLTEENLFYSWIGHALAIRLDKLNFLFNDPEILYDVYCGWKKYRELMDRSLYEHFSGGEINIWNGHWINNKYSKRKQSDSEFNPLENDENIIKNESLDFVSWIQFFFNLSNYKSKQSINKIDSYVYKLDKQDTTFDYVCININEFDNLMDFCEINFNEVNETIDVNDFKKFYEKNTLYLNKLCEFGIIGLFSLKPQLLYLQDENKIKTKLNELNKSLGNKTFKLLKLYIEMKYSEDFVEKAEKFGDFLYRFKKSNGKHLVNDLIKNKNNKNFLITIEEMMTIISNNDDINFLTELYKSAFKNDINVFDFLSYAHIIYINKESNKN